MDRLKTAFFSNVSHEVRTPLTLILGPLDDAIAETKERWQHDRLVMLQRNALRLQKLVNTLLDYSRIEAGRVQVKYEPTDLPKLTEDLASNFRSACEKAGLELCVDCPPLQEAVYVDAEMWEKVVLNLVSNAFKFTFEGRIDVSLQQSDRQVQLTVKDTGVGIPSDQMPMLFERFHRVEGVSGRSNEGSGIGLELVRLHGGEVRAESEVGRGTSFVVSVPLGKDHLPANRISAARPLTSTALIHAAGEAVRFVAAFWRTRLRNGQPHRLHVSGPRTPLRKRCGGCQTPSRTKLNAFASRMGRKASEVLRPGRGRSMVRTGHGFSSWTTTSTCGSTPSVCWPSAIRWRR